MVILLREVVERSDWSFPGRERRRNLSGGIACVMGGVGSSLSVDIGNALGVMLSCGGEEIRDWRERQVETMLSMGPLEVLGGLAGGENGAAERRKC